MDVNIDKSGSDCGHLTNYLKSAFEKLYNLYSLSEAVVAQLEIASSSGLRLAERCAAPSRLDVTTTFYQY